MKVFGIVMIVAVALLGAPAATPKEPAAANPVCAHRVAAGDRNFSFDWPPSDAEPWVQFHSDSKTGTHMVGGVRCGLRHVEWVWEVGQEEPTVYFATDPATH